MSTQPTKRFVYRACDGLYYDSYEKMRDANVRANKKRLNELGLDDARTALKKSKPAKPKRNTSPKPPSPTAVRRSKRVRNVTPDNLGLKYSDRDLFDDEDDFVVGGRAVIHPVTKKKLPIKRRKKTSDDYEGPILTPKERASLKGRKDWLQDFEAYHASRLSDQNFRSVIRQVAKMVSGAGVTYHHWDDGVFFMKGRKIGIEDDFDLLYDEAVEFEEEHGRDLGNGTFICRQTQQ